MDFAYFFNILLRRKWIIISATLVSAVTAWYLVGKMPPTFKSTAEIETGIVHYKGRTLTPENQFIQKYEIDGAFNRLIQDMQSPRSIRLLTKRLLEHEFQPVGHNDSPFRNPDPEIIDLSPTQVEDYATFINNLLGGDSLEIKKNFQRHQKKLAEAYAYDFKSLIENLEIKRKGDTDNLEVSFSSESPELSYFALNAYLEEFLNYFEKDQSSEEVEKVDFYQEVVAEKKHNLDSVVLEINKYKEEHDLISVETQSEAAISQLDEFEKKKKDEEGKIPALKTSIRVLGRKIIKYNKVYAELITKNKDTRSSFAPLDAEIKGIRNKLNNASGKRKERLQDELIALQNERAILVAQIAGQLTNDKHPWHTEVPGWITEKLEKEFELELAEKNVANYSREIRKLYGELGRYQEDDAILRTLEEEKEKWQAEYLSNKATLEDAIQKAEGTDNPLEIVEYPEKAERPEASLRSIIAAFSGVAGGTMTSIFIFLLAFIDTTVQSPSQYKKQMQLPFLGFINKVNMPQLNLYSLFHTSDPPKELASFRENVRKLRSIIETSNEQSFLFVSPKQQEGKSFLMILVAYALSLNNKHILIIDTNFRNNTLSDFKDDPNWDLTGGKKSGLPKFGLGNDTKRLGTSEEGDEKGAFHLKNIDIIGNKRSAQSPSEVLAGKDFAKIMESYRAKYDYILMEAAAMNDFSDMIELEPYADKVVGIFSALSPVGSVDNESIEALRNLDDKFIGGVLNNVDLKNLS